MSRYIEIQGSDDGLEGVVKITIDGFVERISVSWLKDLLRDAGRTFEESGTA